MVPVNSFQKLIVMATAMPQTAPAIVAQPLAQGTNMAMKNSPNKGAVIRFTTL